MPAWTNNALSRIGDAEELEIASLRRDGTLGGPRTIWVVRHDDDLLDAITSPGARAATIRLVPRARTTESA
jgi:hypothetical protein